MDPVELGRRIRAARAYAGMNLPEMAEAVEIGRSTLIEIEHGRRAPKKWELFAIVQVTGVPEEWFSAAAPDLSEGVRAAEEIDQRHGPDSAQSSEGHSEDGHP